MRYSILIFATCITSLIWAQDTLYFDENRIPCSPSKKFEYWAIRQYNPQDSNEVSVFTYYPDGAKRSEMHYSKFRIKRKEKWERWWYPDGQLKRTVPYENGKIHGEVITYWENGMTKRLGYFEKGRQLEGKVMTKSGVEAPNTPYLQKPEFPGGKKAMRDFIANEMRYPKKAKAQQETGMVWVKFEVDYRGEISRIQVPRSKLSEELRQEAIRIVSKMPTWIPGTEDDEPREFSVRIPIHFSLNK